MSFELTILGSSAALPTSKRFPTAQLLKVDERFFLIDCGEGTQIQLRKFGINPVRIHHIFISHLHGDHLFGLFGLLSSMGMMGRKTPLYLYGPEKLKDLIHNHLDFFGPLPYNVEFNWPHPGKSVPVYEDEKITVLPIPLKHRTVTYGYLFREKRRLLNIRKEAIRAYGLGIADLVKIKQGADFTTGEGITVPNSQLTLPPYRQRSYAYISDTVFDPDLADVVKGVDLLYHEATFSEKDSRLAQETMHSTASQAAELANRAGVVKLLIGHFSSRYREYGILVEEARKIFSESVGVNDGDVYSVEPKRVSPE